jgi:hypothetical protein
MYMRNHDELRAAQDEKDYQKLDLKLAEKVCMDAHLFGKATLPLYRSLFSFTGALLILVGEESKPSANLFTEGIFNFL